MGSLALSALGFLTWYSGLRFSVGQEKPSSGPSAANADDTPHREGVKSLLDRYCSHCHNEEKTKSGVRVDQLSATPDEKQLHLLKRVLGQLTDEAMPPDDEPQPTDHERKTLTEWAERSLTTALARDTRAMGRCVD